MRKERSRKGTKDEKKLEYIESRIREKKDRDRGKIR